MSCAWAQDNEAVRMIGRSDKRLRSRTPPVNRHGNSHGGEACCICLEDIGSVGRHGEQPWTCIQCSVVAHVRCMPTNREGQIHLNNGCPGCRVTMTQLIAQVQRPRPASKGIICYACKYIVEEGTPCRSCPAPRHYCQAHWHVDCTPTPEASWTSCPACHLNAFQALRVRRS